MKKLNNANKPLNEHFHDAKFLILHLLILILCATLCGYLLLEYFITYVKINILHGNELHFFNPLEPITFAVKSSFFIGIITFMPLILLRFAVYLYPIVRSKKTFTLQVFLAIILFGFGVFLALKVVSPSVFLIAGKYFAENIATILNTTSTFGIIFLLCIVFGLVSQFPLLIWILISHNIVKIENLQKCRKFYICGSFVTGGVLTPPDVLSQIIVAIILILSFEVTIFILLKCKNLKRR